MNIDKFMWTPMYHQIVTYCEAHAEQDVDGLLDSAWEAFDKFQKGTARMSAEESIDRAFEKNRLRKLELIAAFGWGATEEGHPFWFKVQDETEAVVGELFHGK